MSYIVKNLHFDITCLTKDEVSDMRDLVNQVVNEGKINWDHEAWIVWFKESKFSENQGLLVYSTVFIQRVAMAIIDWLINERGTNVLT